MILGESNVIGEYKTLSKPMKKTLSLCLSLCLFYTVWGQTPTNPAFLKEINAQIWQPFSEAYATNNAQQYIGLHSKDFIRATGGSWKNIADWQNFQENTLKNFATRKPNEKTTIGFRFLERVSDGQKASERGIYQVIRTNEKGDIIGAFYGKFHVFMRKENNRWKIFIDYDSDEGNTINEASFKAAFAIDDLEKY